jgi:hypothetical protein
MTIDVDFFYRFRRNQIGGDIGIDEGFEQIFDSSLVNAGHELTPIN